MIPPPPIVLSVSELTYALKSHVEPVFRHACVRGEISNLHAQASGHLYFSLVEGGAQLAAVLFRGQAASLAQLPKNGDTVIAEGEISIYPPRGTYQLIARQLTNVGQGEVLLRLQNLKKKLHQLGWFSPGRKKKLPQNICTIGLVTSPNGAVLHDIINVLSRRLGTFHLLVNPVKVQGEGAAQQIAKAVSVFNAFALVDVIIICRGGGSAEDLAAFNEEIVAAACVNSTIPIVSAIGHETDLSITDLVADVRAPTPSAAAELVSHEKAELRKKHALLQQALLRTMQAKFLAGNRLLKAFVVRLSQASPQKILETQALRLDDVESCLLQTIRRSLLFWKTSLANTQNFLNTSAPTHKLLERRTKTLQYDRAVLQNVHRLLSFHTAALRQLGKAIEEKMVSKLVALRQQRDGRDVLCFLDKALANRIGRTKKQVEAAALTLQAFSPQKILERGYSIAFRGQSKQVIGSIQSVFPGECVTIALADGSFSAQISSIGSRSPWQ